MSSNKNIIHTNLLLNKAVSNIQEANIRFSIKETRYETYTYVLDVYFDESKAVGSPVLKLELHRDGTLNLTVRWSGQSSFMLYIGNVTETIENRMFNTKDESVKDIVICCLVLYKKIFDIYKTQTEGLHTVVLTKTVKDIWRKAPFQKEEDTRDDLINKLEVDNLKKNNIAICKIQELPSILRNIKLQVM